MSNLVRITFILLALASMGASHASRNFVVQAPTPEIARQVADAAEYHRQKLALFWYGHEIKNWGAPCKVTVNVNDRVGASGATRFRFVNGEVYGWDMEVNGPLVRILDSVVPHEVNHTILACYFRRKVPRWADEGAATLMEHASEQNRQIDFVERLVDDGRRIPLRVLFEMTQYPTDGRQVMALYSQGYSLTEFLIQQGGHRRFLKFLDDAHQHGWDTAVKAHYGHGSIEKLEGQWTGWVMAGSGRRVAPEGQLIAGNQPAGSAGATDGETIIRGQSPSDVSASTTGAEVIPTEVALSELRSQPMDDAAAPVGVFTISSLQAPDPRQAGFANAVAAAEPVVQPASASTAGMPVKLALRTVQPSDDLSARNMSLAGSPAGIASLSDAARDGLVPSPPDSGSRIHYRRLQLTRIDDSVRRDAPATMTTSSSREAVATDGTATKGESAAPTAASQLRTLRETRLRETGTSPPPERYSADWNRFPTRIH